MDGAGTQMFSGLRRSKHNMTEKKVCLCVIFSGKFRGYKNMSSSLHMCALAQTKTPSWPRRAEANILNEEKDRRKKQMCAFFPSQSPFFLPVTRWIYRDANQQQQIENLFT